MTIVDIQGCAFLNLKIAYLIATCDSLTCLKFEYLLAYIEVLMATNRIDSLDPALIRPGRIDRKIEFPLPDEKTKRRIFQVNFCSNFIVDYLLLYRCLDYRFTPLV